ncbi:MAG: universal stress protein [Saprospiraceae bacterium]
MNFDSAHIIDVRSEKEFNYGHVQGSVNIPLEQINNHIAELKNFETLIVYCRSGNRSVHAKRILDENGIHNVIDGGALESTAQLLNRRIVIDEQKEESRTISTYRNEGRKLRILIPSDFTPQTSFARIMGEKLAEYMDLSLHFVHVIDLPETVTLDNNGNVFTCGEIDPAYVERLKREGEDKLNALKVNAKVETTTEIKFGKLTDTILSLADTMHIDVIIVGTKGLWGLKEKLTVTQAQILARKSNIPVLSLMCDRSDLEIQNILFVHDFKESKEKHPEFMNTLVEASNAKVFQLYISKSLSVDSEQNLLAQMDMYAKDHNIQDYENRIIIGDDIESGVSKFLSDQDADIVFIGTHGDGGVFHSSSAEALVKHLFKPIVTFHLD